AKVRGTTLGSNDISDGGRESLFKAVFDLLVASQCAKPLLVVLDDLQWADEATVLLLRDLAERLGNSKIVVLGTYWESDLDPERPFTGVVARLLRRRRAQRMLIASAVIGRDFDVALLEVFGELSGGEVREALEEATKARLLSKSGNERYRFSHDLVRQRVLAAMPLPRLQAYHLAVGDT